MESLYSMLSTSVYKVYQHLLTLSTTNPNVGNWQLPMGNEIKYSKLSFQENPTTSC